MLHGVLKPFTAEISNKTLSLSVEFWWKTLFVPYENLSFALHILLSFTLFTQLQLEFHVHVCWGS